MGCSESKVNKVAVQKSKASKNRNQNNVQSENEWPELRTSSPEPIKNSKLDISGWDN